MCCMHAKVNGTGKFHPPCSPVGCFPPHPYLYWQPKGVQSFVCPWESWATILYYSGTDILASKWQMVAVPSFVTGSGCINILRPLIESRPLPSLSIINCCPFQAVNKDDSACFISWLSKPGETCSVCLHTFILIPYQLLSSDLTLNSPFLCFSSMLCEILKCTKMSGKFQSHIGKVAGK